MRRRKFTLLDSQGVMRPGCKGQQAQEWLSHRLILETTTTMACTQIAAYFCPLPRFLYDLKKRHTILATQQGHQRRWPLPRAILWLVISFDAILQKRALDIHILRAKGPSISNFPSTHDMTQLTDFSFVVLDFLDGEKKKKRGAAEGSVGHAACAPCVQPARDPSSMSAHSHASRVLFRWCSRHCKSWTDHRRRHC